MPSKRINFCSITIKLWVDFSRLIVSAFNYAYIVTFCLYLVDQKKNEDEKRAQEK